MKLRLVTYQATLMIVIAAIYVWLRSAPGERLQTFAMLSLTAIGATELALAVIALFRRRAQHGKQIISHLLAGAGALAMGYGLLDGVSMPFFVTGALLLGTGVILWQESVRPSVDAPRAE
jgi:peptidoglycan/LPS O-acetylase OafA/YrhL